MNKEKAIERSRRNNTGVKKTVQKISPKNRKRSSKRGVEGCRKLA